MGVYASRRVAASDLEAIAIATGGTIVSNVEELEPAGLGSCGTVREKKYELSPSPLLFFDDVPNDTVASSIWCLLQQNTLLTKSAGALDDAVGVIYVAHTDNDIIAGGGSAYMSMSLAVKELRFIRRWKGAISG